MKAVPKNIFFYTVASALALTACSFKQRTTKQPASVAEPLPWITLSTSCEGKELRFSRALRKTGISEFIAVLPIAGANDDTIYSRCLSQGSFTLELPPEWATSKITSAELVRTDTHETLGTYSTKQAKKSAVVSLAFDKYVSDNFSDSTDPVALRFSFAGDNTSSIVLPVVRLPNALKIVETTMPDLLLVDPTLHGQLQPRTLSSKVISPALLVEIINESEVAIEVRLQELILGTVYSQVDNIEHQLSGMMGCSFTTKMKPLRKELFGETLTILPLAEFQTLTDESYAQLSESGTKLVVIPPLTRMPFVLGAAADVAFDLSHPVVVPNQKWEDLPYKCNLTCQGFLSPPILPQVDLGRTYSSEVQNACNSLFTDFGWKQGVPIPNSNPTISRCLEWDFDFNPDDGRRFCKDKNHDANTWRASKTTMRMPVGESVSARMLSLGDDIDADFTLHRRQALRNLNFALYLDPLYAAGYSPVQTQKGWLLTRCLDCATSRATPRGSSALQHLPTSLNTKDIIKDLFK